MLPPLTRRYSRLALLAWLLTGLPASPPLLAADPAPAGGSERLLPDKEQERMMALAASQPVDTEVLWLETQHESYLGLFQPATRPEPRGGILLLPHDRTSPDWPGAMQTLRRGLPDKGWHSLAIALPDEPLPILPRFATTASDAADSTEPPLKDHYQQISQRIDQALRTLRERGADKVYLVGEGSGAYWASRFLSDNNGQRLYPILIDAVQPTTADMPLLHRLISDLQLPALDLYHGSGLDREPVEQQAGLRADAAKRAALSQYLSVRMAPNPGDWRQTDPRLLSLVSGLIERHLEPATRAPSPAAAPPPDQRPGDRQQR